MRFIAPTNWKLGKSGRLIRVIKRPRRRPIQINTSRFLVGRDRERFEIIQMLKKQRIQREREKRKQAESALKKRDASLRLTIKGDKQKAFCNTCGKMRDIINVAYSVTDSSTINMLNVCGECTKCGRPKVCRFLRKATDEEMRAFGIKKRH